MDRGRQYLKRSRSRSRSRSPDVSYSRNKTQKQIDRERLEAERKERMARLRAENEEDEMKMAAVTGNDGKYTGGHGSSKPRSAKEAIVEVKDEELEGLDEEEQMQKLLGFGGFESTKGKMVEENQTSLARGSSAKNKARKYRQYMNRKGGFNRSLDKMN